MPLVTSPGVAKTMTQHVIAFPTKSQARGASSTFPGLDETMAAIAAAGRTMADLRARLEQAERSIAALRIDKRALEAELKAARGGAEPRRDGPAASRPSPQANPLDQALATIAQGLGPALVRAP